MIVHKNYLSSGFISAVQIFITFSLKQNLKLPESTVSKEIVFSLSTVGKHVLAQFRISEEVNRKNKHLVLLCSRINKITLQGGAGCSGELSPRRDLFVTHFTVIKN